VTRPPWKIILAIVIGVFAFASCYRYFAIESSKDSQAEARLSEVRSHLRLGWSTQRVKAELSLERVPYYLGSNWNGNELEPSLYVQLAGGTGIFQEYHRLVLDFNRQDHLQRISTDYYADGL
jgi:hypothetical protein